MIRRQANLSCQARPGVVIVITLLAVLLMAGMVMYIHNIGKQTTARIETQNAADAAAISAAGSLARSYNTVAQNNVAISKLIAQTIAMDAFPRAIRETLNEQQALYEAIEAKLPEVPNNLWYVQYVLDDMLGNTKHGFAHSSMIDDIKWLEELYESYPGTDDNKNVDYLTRYPTGEFWQAMSTLSDLSQATIEMADELAITAGRQAALESVHGNDNPGIAIMRLGSNIAYTVGSFDDFKDPVTRGLLPPQIDRRSGPDQPGFPQFRGPYDTIFGWRHYDYANFSSTGQQDHTNSFPRPPVGANITTGTPPAGPIEYIYYTYGPLREAINPIDGLNTSRLPFSHFEAYYDSLVFQKLDMLWPGAYQHGWNLWAPNPVRRNNWVQGRPSSSSSVTQTMYMVIEINSSQSSAMLESPSDNPPTDDIPTSLWRFVKRPPRRVVPYIGIVDGWCDPLVAADRDQLIAPNNRTANYSWTRITDDIWRFEDKVNNPNVPGTQYYWIAYFILVGTNDGPVVAANNPFDGLNPDAPSVPRPVYFDPQDNPFWDGSHVPLLPVEGESMPSHLMDQYIEARRNHLTFFAAVGQDDQTDTRRLREYLDPSDMTAAVAQAHVFNNHSFDLWTQMWRSQLERIDPEQYGRWLDQATVQGDDTSRLLTYLHNTRGLAEMLRH